MDDDFDALIDDETALARPEGGAEEAKPPGKGTPSSGPASTEAETGPSDMEPSGDPGEDASVGEEPTGHPPAAIDVTAGAGLGDKRPRPLSPKKDVDDEWLRRRAAQKRKAPKAREPGGPDFK